MKNVENLKIRCPECLCDKIHGNNNQYVCHRCGTNFYHQNEQIKINKEHICPKCQSTNIVEQNHVLNCNICKYFWRS